MSGNVEMNYGAPMMGQNDKDKEDSKVQRRHHEEIRRDQILQQVLPLLRNDSPSVLSVRRWP